MHPSEKFMFHCYCLVACQKLLWWLLLLACILYVESILFLSICFLLSFWSIFGEFIAEVIPNKRKRKIITSTPSGAKQTITYAENNASKTTEPTASPIAKRVEHESKPLLSSQDFLCVEQWKEKLKCIWFRFVSRWRVCETRNWNDDWICWRGQTISDWGRRRNWNFRKWISRKW